MYERRTFDASDEIILRVTAGGNMVGEEWKAPAARAPTIQATIDAPATILRVDIVRNGKFVHTSRPNPRRATVTWRDSDATRRRR